MKHTMYKLKEYLYLKEYNTFINKTTGSVMCNTPVT